MRPPVLLVAITQQYLTSGDFNGLPLRRILGDVHEETRASLRALIEQGLVTIVFGDIHPNPHIKALSDEPVGDTLAKIDALGIEHACAYPTRAHLTVKAISNSSDMPSSP